VSVLGFVDKFVLRAVAGAPFFAMKSHKNIHIPLSLPCIAVARYFIMASGQFGVTWIRYSLNVFDLYLHLTVNVDRLSVIR